MEPPLNPQAALLLAGEAHCRVRALEMAFLLIAEDITGRKFEEEYRRLLNETRSRITAQFVEAGILSEDQWIAFFDNPIESFFLDKDDAGDSL